MLSLAGTLHADAPDGLRETRDRALERQAPEIPLNLQDKIQAYRSEQQALVQARRELAESLQDATAEERRAAILAFQEENAERVAAQRALGEQIRESAKELQPSRPDLSGRREVERPEVPAEVEGLMSQFREAREALMTERREILEQVKDASAEERKAALSTLRETQREQIEAQRELAKAIRDEMKEIRKERRRP